MAPLVVALQTMVAIQALQAVALVLAVVYLVRRLRFEAAQNRRHESAQLQLLAAGLAKLGVTVGAARAESATFLEAVFSGVRGMARNLDAARATSAQTLEEMRRRFDPLGSDPSPQPSEAPAEVGRLELDALRPGRSLQESRLAEMVRLRETQARRRLRGQAG
jgi:hypothetical protein